MTFDGCRLRYPYPIVVALAGSVCRQYACQPAQHPGSHRSLVGAITIAVAMSRGRHETRPIPGRTDRHVGGGRCLRGRLVVFAAGPGGRAPAGGCQQSDRSGARRPRQVLRHLPQPEAQDRRAGAERRRGPRRRQIASTGWCGRKWSASCAPGAMPPAGSPRPDQATYDAISRSSKRPSIAAAKTPSQSGPRRLVPSPDATEYANAIRDLLDLPALPKELDITTLLPPDNSSTGFDNLADLLFVSPTALDGYLSAARKISRLAVGDPAIPVIVDRYQLPPGPAAGRAAGGRCRFGTRGGVVIRSTLPVDGEYRVKIEFAGNGREPHQLEVSVDGARAHLFDGRRQAAWPTRLRRVRAGGRSRRSTSSCRSRPVPRTIAVAYSSTRRRSTKSWSGRSMRDRGNAASARQRHGQRSAPGRRAPAIRRPPAPAGLPAIPSRRG